MKYIITTLFFLFALDAFCCKCKTISKEFEFENSDYVFIGNVFKVTDSYFFIKPIEFFKGSNLDNVKVEINECSVLPKDNEYWLIYTNEMGTDLFSVSQCGWSRSLNQSLIDIVPPPPINSKKIDEIRTTVYFNDRLSILEAQLDILNLRQMKIYSEIESKAIAKPDSNDNENLTKWTFILVLILLSLFIVLTATVMFKIYKKGSD